MQNQSYTEATSAESIIIACADVGSIQRDRFGWGAAVPDGTASLETSGRCIAAFARKLSEWIEGGRKVALGFECPLFVPISEDPAGLTRARNGEGNRPWSAGAGAAALATGLTETVWLLREMRRRLVEPPPIYQDWDVFLVAPTGLLVWEAFVTAGAKGASHEEDALIAVRAFLHAMPSPPDANAVHEECVHSLVLAAAIRAGWDVAPSRLSEPCLVIKAADVSPMP